MPERTSGNGGFRVARGHETTRRNRLRPRAARRRGAGIRAVRRPPLRPPRPRSERLPPVPLLRPQPRRAVLGLAAGALPPLPLLARPAGHLLQRGVGILGPAERPARFHQRPALA